MVVLPIEDDDAVHACKSAPSLLLLGAPGGGDDKSLETARRNMSVLRRRRPSSVLWSSFRSFRCVCVLCFEEEEEQFHHHHPIFCFLFFFGKISFLTSSKNFTFFFIDDFQAKVFRYSSVWCQIKLYLSTRTNCTKSRLHC